MKIKLGILIFLLAAASLRAQTNNLTELLQQGLFEEQANRNFDAAVANYQKLAAQFDKDRQLAATAVFRLGECYRAQGKTNEAFAQYQRILRDFSDQESLANLSRQDLAGMGLSQTLASAAPSSVTVSTETTALAAQISGLEKLNDPEERARAVLAIFPDEDLKNMLLTLPKLREWEAEIKANPKLTWRDLAYRLPIGADPGEALSIMNSTNYLAFAQWEVRKQLSLIEERVNFILGLQRARLKVLQAGAGTPVAQEPPPAAPGGEEQEIEGIRQMIRDSPDLINTSFNGTETPPLIYAAMSDHLRMAQFLLDHGADVNVSHRGSTPLTEAVSFGHKAMLELLLSHGANVNAIDGNNKTALHEAVEHGFETVVEVLLANHADVNNMGRTGMTPLAYAATFNHPKIVRMLLKAGADPNLKGAKGEFPLVCATQQSPELVKDLLSAGANPNVETAEGRTPLSLAVQNGSADIVKLLLAAKADANGGKLDAPLLTATERGNAALAELLLQAGANPNAKGEVGLDNTQTWTVTTPLSLAVAKNELPMVQVLLKFKADPNAAQSDERPLAFKALSKPDILEALLDAGAKVNFFMPYDSGSSMTWTLLDAAATEDHPKSLEILLKHGADPNLAQSDGKTALYWAAAARSVDQKIFELLLDYKADPNIPNSSGHSILELVKDRKDIADLLRQHGAREKLPDWNTIEVSRPSANFSFAVFHKGTNDWNHFTLLDALFDYYASTQMYDHQAGLSRFDHAHNDWSVRDSINRMPFPDLGRIVIVRPSKNSTNETHIAVNLLNSTNGVDCTKDVPLEFGDVVEIPEREHPLDAHVEGLTESQSATILDHLKGSVQLMVRHEKVELPLNPIHFGATIIHLLNQSEAQKVLWSSSDLAHVTVIRRNPATRMNYLWTLDCAHPPPAQSFNYGPVHEGWGIDLMASYPPPALDLWLRNGDVIEVPEKKP